MKVLVISPKFHPIIGGGETYVLNSVKLLHKAGIDVQIAVEPNANRRLNEFEFKVHEIEGLSDSNLNVNSASIGLKQLIDSFQPEAIHVHGYYALLAAGLANTANLPILASIHSTPVWGTRLIGLFEDFKTELHFVRSILDAAKPKIVTAANDVYAEAALKVVESKFEVKVLPYPIEMNHFSQKSNSIIRNEFGLSNLDKLILTPSRIIERKGIKEVIASLNHLPKNFYLCLPGAYDPLDKEFWNQITSSEEFRKVENRVIVPSRPFTYHEMPDLYGACDVIVMPSYYEGAPVATVEAMSSGKPFVGADSQGINGFIRDRVNGLLVAQKTVLELANAIKKVADDKILSDKLSSQAAKDIEHLSWDNQLPALIETYQRISVQQSSKNLYKSETRLAI